MPNRSNPDGLKSSARQSIDWAREHLGDRSVYGRSMFIAYLLLTQVLRLAALGNRAYMSFPDFILDLGWLVLSRAAVFGAFVWILRSDKSKVLTPIRNTTSAALISLIALTLDYYLQPEDNGIFRFGVVPTSLWVAAVTVLAYAIYAPIVVSFRRHRDGVKSLVEVQASLMAYMDEIAFKSELAEQIRRSQLDAIVLPQVQKIREAIGAGGKTSLESIERLKSLINENVRPLSKRYLEEKISLREVKVTRPLVSVFAAFMHPKPLSEAVRPLSWFVILGPIYVLGDVLVYGPGVILFSIIATTIWALTLAGVALVIPKRVVANGFVSSLFAGILGYVVWIPIDRQIAFEMHDAQNIPLIRISGLALSFGLISLFAFSREITIALTGVVENRNAESLRLQQKLAEFNRNEWVLQRNWSYLLHGKIQAGLSAALVKLGQAQADNSRTTSQKRTVTREVGKILDSVIETLRDPQIMDVDLFDSLEEQKSLWSGTCEIRFALPEQVEARIAADTEARFALNEMANEAILNAVKHGQAKTLSISFDLEQDSLIKFKAVNDGKAPSKDTKKSLGSKLFDDLAERWSLTRLGKKTTLLALVRLAPTS